MYLYFLILILLRAINQTKDRIHYQALKIFVRSALMIEKKLMSLYLI
jgi:hypothetical protein